MCIHTTHVDYACLNSWAWVLVLQPNNTASNEENIAVKLFWPLYVICFSQLHEVISPDYISESIRLFYMKKSWRDLLILYSIFFDFGNIWVHIYSDIKEYNHVLLNHIYFNFLYSGSSVYMFLYSPKFNMWFYNTGSEIWPSCVGHL